MKLLTSLLSLVGLNSELYNGHSFRIGAATQAGTARIEDHLIQTLGRWSSDCYKRYIQTESVTIAQVQRQMSVVYRGEILP